MRLTLLLVFLTIASLSSLAQGDDLYFEENIVTQGINPGETDIPAETTIVNPTSTPLVVRWIREVNSLPRNWQSAICDINLCYLPTVDSAEFTIPANSSSPIIVHVYPDGPGVEAQVTLRILEVADRSNNAVATFSFSMVSSTFGPKSPYSIKLYPNPVSEEFSIQSDYQLSEVVISNMLGKVVKVYPGDQEFYNISDLPNGIYLASLRGRSGDILKTLRLSKRMSMP